MSSQLRSPTLRTPLSVARGHGAAGDGVHHWRAQRITAIALIPLTLWFVIGVLSQLGRPHEHVVAWLSSPWVATGALLFVVLTFYHAHLGLQTVIEDYVADKAKRIAALLIVNGALLLLGTVSALAIVRTAL